MLFQPTIIAIGALLVISGLLFGIFGFGYALVSISLLPFLIGVKIAIPMVALQVPFFQGFMLYRLRRHVNIRLVLPLVLGLILGTPLGVYLLHILSEVTIRKLLGSMILLHSVWSIRRASPAAKLIDNNTWGLLAGFLSGVIGGAILASGPIVMVYLTLRGLSKERLKGSFLVWSMAQACLLIPFYALSGILTSKVFLWGLITVPFASLGVLIGIRLFNRLNEQAFYRLIIIFLTVIGVRMLFF